MLPITFRRLVRSSGRQNLFSSISSFPLSEVNDVHHCDERYIYSPGELRRLGTIRKRSPIDGTSFNLLRDCGILRPFRGCRAGGALKFRNHIGSLNIQSVFPSRRVCIPNPPRPPPLSRHVIQVRHASVAMRKKVENLVPLLCWRI